MKEYGKKRKRKNAVVNRYGKTHCKNGHEYAIHGRIQPSRKNRIICTACRKDSVCKKYEPEYILGMLEKHDVSLSGLAPILDVFVGNLHEWASYQPEDIKARLAVYKRRNIKSFERSWEDYDVLSRPITRKSYTDYENKGVPTLPVGSVNSLFTR